MSQTPLTEEEAKVQEALGIDIGYCHYCKRGFIETELAYAVILEDVGSEVAPVCNQCWHAGYEK